MAESAEDVPDQKESEEEQEEQPNLSGEIAVRPKSGPAPLTVPDDSPTAARGMPPKFGSMSPGSPMVTHFVKLGSAIQPGCIDTDFQRVKKIGMGGYGDVFLVKYKDEAKTYAMKVSKPDTAPTRILAEKHILEACDNVFILTMFACFIGRSLRTLPFWLLYPDCFSLTLSPLPLPAYF